MKLLIITNIPTPYRDPIYTILSKYDNIDLFVFYCSLSEPNRKWNYRYLDFNHKFLSKHENKFVRLNFNILKELNQLNPDVVITSGFNFTMLIAWLWSIIKFKKHIPFSDGNIHSESNLSFLHKILRMLVYRYSDAFLGSSQKTLDLYKSYKIDQKKLFKSCLSVDNKKFFPKIKVNKIFDLMFCGQFIQRKNPLFFVELAKFVNDKKPGINVLLVGEGPLKFNTLTKLNEYEISYFDAGFVQSSEIISYYHSSKLFIFPTLKEPWGLVANEALASGLPVFVSSFAGVANELIIDGYNGFIFDDFELNSWSEKILNLLNDDILYDKISNNSILSVKSYTNNSAAEGIFNSVKQFVYEDSYCS
ncbi:glycosyltransferase family 4 protein [uncultured Algoriphagus sp.]|uniref:glycosyltransferase family 4 protein n=1 Tax=uncultured Algoriphagus sp. TaxID=417365 RepID=UPI0025945E6A|nr:glycosyltransferase family 4 protein [uncultured Algoriphagus sp.]